MTLYCPELDLVTCGSTLGKTRKNFADLVEEYYLYLIDNEGQLDAESRAHLNLYRALKMERKERSSQRCCLPECDGLRAEEALFTIPDKDGTPITLTKERWEDHILVGHPAMAKHLEAIRLTISDPDYILQSDKRADTRLFYRLGVTEGKYSNLYVVVVMRYTASAGFVRTAYLALKPIAGGEVVWIRPKH